jgi:hypothetical protein
VDGRSEVEVIVDVWKQVVMATEKYHVIWVSRGGIQSEHMLL